VLSLQQLQHLTVELDLKDDEEQKLVLQLPQLAALQTLSLGYKGLEGVAAAAATWVLLPQLKDLGVVYWLGDWQPGMQAVYEGFMASIVAGAAAATWLTSLHLAARGTDRQGHAKPGAISVCGSLTSLAGLRELQLADVCLAPGDALALTALTGLTCLVLNGVRDGVGDGAAVGVARSLTQLQQLELRRCSIDLGSSEYLLAVGQLRQLTALLLEGNSGLTQQGLMLLTGLRDLQRLAVDKSEEVTDEVIARFWAVLHEAADEFFSACSSDVSDDNEIFMMSLPL
jgi:hypothetical protein